MEHYWSIFYDALIQSISEIDSVHFRVSRYEGELVLRERAYCYELYHQLRIHLGDDFPFTLHGEIDKRGHEFVCKFFDENPNPDFVVHIPGSMENLAVIEVKTSRMNILGARKDIDKIQTFISKVSYQYGIFLIFGPDDPRNVVEQLGVTEQNIFVFWHRDVGTHPDLLHPKPNP